MHASTIGHMQHGDFVTIAAHVCPQDDSTCDHMSTKHATSHVMSIYVDLEPAPVQK